MGVELFLFSLKKMQLFARCKKLEFLGNHIFQTFWRLNHAEQLAKSIQMKKTDHVFRQKKRV